MQMLKVKSFLLSSHATDYFSFACEYIELDGTIKIKKMEIAFGKCPEYFCWNWYDSDSHITPNLREMGTEDGQTAKSRVNMEIEFICGIWNV